MQLARLTLLALVLGWSTAVTASAELVFESTERRLQPAVDAAVVVERYAFKNTGDTAVLIGSMESDCSCTTASVAKELVAPGEAGEIVVRFEVGNRHGPQKRVVVVSTDEVAKPQHVLSLTADFPQVVTPSAPMLLWGEKERAAAKSLTVKVSAQPPVTELKARAASGSLTAAVERLSATEYRVTVTPAPGAKDVSAPLYLDATLASGPAKRSTVFLRVR